MKVAGGINGASTDPYEMGPGTQAPSWRPELIKVIPVPQCGWQENDPPKMSTSSFLESMDMLHYMAKGK